jgi:hypothetical protein
MLERREERPNRSSQLPENLAGCRLPEFLSVGTLSSSVVLSDYSLDMLGSGVFVMVLVTAPLGIGQALVSEGPH